MIYRSVSCNKQMACGDFNDSTKTNVTRDSMINDQWCGVTDESVSQLVAENREEFRQSILSKKSNEG